MQYEIRSIDPVGNDRTVMVEVAYWYFDTAIGNRQPDFVEHVIFHDIPVREPRPVRNELGQLVRADGILDPAYVELDGEWVEWVPQPNDPKYLWEQASDDPGATVEYIIQQRAQQAMLRGRKGADVFVQNEKPKVRPGNTNLVAKNAKLRGMRGKRGKI